MGKVVERKKKKKGRPSLLDLQKRSLREQQEQLEQQQQQQQKQQQQQQQPKIPNPKFRNSIPTPTPIRRSTRRSGENSPAEEDNADTAGEEDDDDDDDEDSTGNRREKKLKLVLKLPSEQANSYPSDSNADDANPKKRKINAIGDGSEIADSEKGEKKIVSGTESSLQGTQVGGGPSTPLPDQKLLLFILDRLQKKDTYGVFSEPVDPKELPDYFEVIEHPMDFGTMKQKVMGGAYAYLEQFEKDVFLLCSNAMQYNSPDTIYFRQARSIQELAKKNFENLRQDSDDNKSEPKIVRRGRPPTKNLKKPVGRPSLDRAGSAFSDATLATGGENTNWSSYDLRRGPLLLDKSGPPESSGRATHVARSSEAHTGRLAEHKFERSDDFTGSILKGVKHGKKHFVLDESRRNTYMQCQPSAGVREPSVMTTFDGEKKMLMAVGLHSEHGFARSLSRFAANLGPVAWKIASKKIERSLPIGIKFGPGWVGENEVTPQRPMLLLPSALSGQRSPAQPLSLTRNSSPAATSSAMESKSDQLPEKPEEDNSSEKPVLSTPAPLDGHPSKPIPPSVASSSSNFGRSSEPSAGSAGALKGLNSNPGFNIPNSGVGASGPRPPFQIHQGPVVHPGMNGFNSAYGFNLSPQTAGKLIGATRPPGFNFQSPRIIDTISRTNTNSVHPVISNSLHSENPKLSETINPSSSLVNSGCEGSAASSLGFRPQPSWQGLSPQQKPDSVPPDLNVRFQSPGSPSSSRVDSMQPDLALQL